MSMYTSVVIIGIPPFLREGYHRVPGVVHFLLPNLGHYCITSDNLAKRAVALMRQVDPKVQCNDEWGHDHAGWSVLKHLYPEADVPVFLISIDMTAPLERHVQMARSLAPLRDEGVLILGSGNIVHNLRDADLSNLYAPPDERGISFDKTVKEALLSGDIDTLLNYRQVGEPAIYSVPTTDHYLPLLYAAGLREEGESLSFICEMFQNRSVSMRSFVVGG